MDITGIAAVKEHFPKPDKSLIKATFFMVLKSCLSQNCYCCGYRKYHSTIITVQEKWHFKNTQFCDFFRGQLKKYTKPIDILGIREYD